MDTTERGRLPSPGQPDESEFSDPRKYNRNRYKQKPKAQQAQQAQQPEALLQDSLGSTTIVQRLKESNLKLSAQNERAEEEVERCHDQIARQASQNHQLQIQVSKLERQVANLQEQLDRDRQGSTGELNRLSQALAEAQEEVIVSGQRSKEQQDTIEGLQATVEQFREKCFNLESDLDNKCQENEDLKRELERYEVDFLAGNGEQGSRGISGATLKIEVDQLRKDNAHLLKLLKQTKEYGQFGEYAEDSGGNAMRVPTDQQPELDEQQWVPSDAFQMAYQFRSQHGNDLSPELINQLLSNLNKIWQEREKKQIQRIKVKSTEEITKLKRQLVSRTPYDALQAKKTISRLTTELNAAKAELNKAQLQKDKNLKNPVGTELIDNTLQIVTQIQQQKKVIQAENESLKDQISQLQRNMHEGIDEKKKYMEGAVWMGKKLSNEIEKVCQSFEFLLIEYHQRLAPAATHSNVPLGDTLTEAQLINASQWLVEAVKQAGFDLYEKTITILEGAMFHMEEAEGRDHGIDS